LFNVSYSNSRPKKKWNSICLFLLKSSTIATVINNDDFITSLFIFEYISRLMKADSVDNTGIWNTPYVIDSKNTDFYLRVKRAVVVS
jgi:GT2 family glycosyltransferase